MGSSEQFPTYNLLNSFHEETCKVLEEQYFPIFDSILSKKSPDLLNKLNQIRNITIPILASIPNDNIYSQDSEGHAKRVLSLIVQLFKPSLETQLNARELFIMALLCLVHDIGMKPTEDCQDNSKKLYERHCDYSSKYVKSLRTNNDLELEQDIIDAVAELCSVHNKPISEAKLYLDFLKIENCRLTLIYSMFKIADMLEFNLQPGEILRMPPNLIGKTIAYFNVNYQQQILSLTPTYDSEKRIFDLWVKELKKRFQEAKEEFSKIGLNYTLKTD